MRVDELPKPEEAVVNRVVDKPFRAAERLRTPRTRWTVTLIAVAVVALAASLLAGVFAGKARALSPQVAQEHIGSTTSLSQTQTNLGSLTFTPGVSYVVLADVELTTSASDTGPISAECFLNVTNEPNDLEEADLNDVKGSQVADISLEGLGNALSAQGTPTSGAATVYCSEEGNPGAPAGLVVAKNARIIAIPVDGVTSNLNTYGP